MRKPWYPSMNPFLSDVKSVQIRVYSGQYIPVFGLNTGKYGPEITPYLDTFHAVQNTGFV